MKKFAYIFPNGEYFECNGKHTENHIETVKTFLAGLQEVNKPLYNRLVLILRTYYNKDNYDDFAVFTLGWIKLTSHNITTICFAGYDFQWPILTSYMSPQYIIDDLPNFSGNPIVITHDLDYIEIIRIGKEKHR